MPRTIRLMHRRAATALMALALVAGCSDSEPAGPPDLTPTTGSLAGTWICAVTFGTQTTTEPTDFRWEGAGQYGWFDENNNRLGTWRAVTNDRLDVVEFVGINTPTGFLNVTSNRMTGTIALGTSLPGQPPPPAPISLVCTR